VVFYCFPDGRIVAATRVSKAKAILDWFDKCLMETMSLVKRIANYD